MKYFLVAVLALIGFSAIPTTQANAGIVIDFGGPVIVIGGGNRNCYRGGYGYGYNRYNSGYYNNYNNCNYGGYRYNNSGYRYNNYRYNNCGYGYRTRYNYSNCGYRGNYNRGCRTSYRCR
ncbi:MAG: hypothetical protein ACAI35_10920 [Candidatus Methylacidiphilales bacterium]|nr:hypothetical protein [Candidatus Methylacidiphilales bacterium]